jgi:enoyl-CoA hydratase
MFAREDRSSVAVLRMAHRKASALDLEFVRGLSESLAAIERGDTRAMVLTGTGSIFSAGVDLLRLTREGAPYVREFLPAMNEMFLRLYAMPMPVVAAVNGHAIAGGAILTWACDRALMAWGKGRIGAPELIVGVPFPLVPLEIARAALAKRAAQEAILAGTTLEPEAALARGYVDELADPDELLDHACAWATKLAAAPRTSWRLTKAALRGPTLEYMRERGPANDRAVTEAWCSEEVLGAVRAYVEKTLGPRTAPAPKPPGAPRT